MQTNISKRLTITLSEAEVNAFDTVLTVLHEIDREMCETKQLENLVMNNRTGQVVETEEIFDALMAVEMLRDSISRHNNGKWAWGVLDVDIR